MARSMKLDLKVGGIDQLNRAAAAAHNLSSGLYNLEKQQKKNAAAGGGGAGGSSTGVGGSGGGRSIKAPPKPYQGPSARLASASTALQVAQAGGDPGEIFDAQYRFDLAKRHVQRANTSLSGGPDFQSRLMTAIRSTRFGGADGVQPLVGRTLDVLGPGMAKFAGPVAAAAAAAVAFGKAVDMSAKILFNIAKNRAVAGGTFGETAALGKLSSVLGGDMASRARSLQEQSAAGGLASLLLSQYGYRELPGFGRSTNAARGFLDVAQKIVSDPNQQRALRTAQETGLEDIFALRSGSPSKVKRLFETLSSVSPSDVRAATDFTIEMGLLKHEFSQLAVAMTPFVSLLSSSIAPLTNLLNLLNRLGLTRSPIQMYGELIEKAWDKFNLPSSGGFAGGGGWNTGGGGKSRSPQVDALDRNTEALVANTDAMRNFFGGGIRAQGAVPAAWRNMILDQAMRNDAIALGAFEI